MTSSREKVGRKVGKPTISTQVFDIIGCVAETVGPIGHSRSTPYAYYNKVKSMVYISICR